MLRLVSDDVSRPVRKFRHAPTKLRTGVLAVGDRVPDATIFLGPDEPMTVLELLEDGPKLLVFYLFDWSST